MSYRKVGKDNDISYGMLQPTLADNLIKEITMSTNYMIKEINGTDEEEEILGTRHFIAGKKVFTFVFPLKDFIQILLYEYKSRVYIREEGTNVLMTVHQFNKEVLAECEEFLYKKGKS